MRNPTLLPAEPQPRTLEDRHVRVETPEHVAVGYELAGLGSRFAALLLDLVIVVAGMVTMAVVFALLIGTPEWVRELWAAVATLASFVWFWGYFILFEGFRDGQTPGKRVMGIRAVQDGGYALSPYAAAVRNLLRLVDIQPLGSCLLGGGVMMLHPLSKRLGDLAAGTVVVRDRPGAALPEEAAAETEAAGPPRMGAEEFDLLARYVARRQHLAAEVRAATAARMADRLDRALRDDPRRAHMTPDAWLSLVHQEEAGRQRAAASAGRGSAQAAALVRRQRARWNEYAALLERARSSGLHRLPAGEVSRFGALYREVAADLARARTYGGSPEMVYLLERSVGSGHNLLYRPTARRSWALLKRWLAHGFPALVRRRWRPIALASACFYVPAVAAFAVLRAEPSLAREVVPVVLMARAEEALAKEARGEGYVEIPVLSRPGAATGLMTNNIGVTFTAFAGGMLAGAGTVLSLVFNGLLLGAVAAVFANVGAGTHLWTFVAPHGAVELTAICIAGGAGFLLAEAIVMPGRRTRARALAENGREAVSLIAGTTMLLVIAGVIEGFISPSDLPRAGKFAFAAVIAVLLVVYLLRAGRGRVEGEG